jgi:hypothetical protein
MSEREETARALLELDIESFVSEEEIVRVA